MRNRFVVWGVFLAVHVWVAFLALYAPGLPQGDVILVYQPWVNDALSGGPIVGITEPWVYPILALVPMLAVAWAGASYLLAWLVLVVVLNAVAFALLLGRGTSKRRILAAWWWLAYLLLLGPIAVTRIDAISVPFAVVAVLVVARRPRVAAMLLTLAAWMKIWPAAVLAALVVASRRRWRMVAAAAATSVVVIVVALIAGSGVNVLSFITEQTGRGLQIESPAAIPYLWMTALGVDGASIYYSREILTFQVTGPNIDLVISALTPLLALAVAATGAVGIWAMRRGAHFVRIAPPLALALVVVLIAFNKVGSPQFATWIIAPVIFALLYGGARRAAVPAVIALVLAALTQLLYPYFYSWLLAADPFMVTVITVRNIGWFVLYAWAVRAVWRSSRPEPVVSQRLEPTPSGRKYARSI